MPRTTNSVVSIARMVLLIDGRDLIRPHSFVEVLVTYGIVGIITYILAYYNSKDKNN